MAKRLTNTTYKMPDGTGYRIELWDNSLAPVGLGSKLELGEEGFRISWEGEEDAPSPVFLPSALNMTCIATQVQRTDIINAVWGDEEYNLVVRVYATDELDNEKLFWAGVVLPESVKEFIEDGFVQISFRATDGISLLKEINFLGAGNTRYTGEKDAIEWIYECLRKVPTHNYLFSNLATDMFLEERMIIRPITDTYTAFANGEAVLDSIQIDSNSLYQDAIEEARIRDGYEMRKPKRDEIFKSTYEVLYNIVGSLGATLCLGDGRWQLFDRERVVNQADDSEAGYFSWYLDGTWEHTAITNTTPIDFDADGKHLLLGATRGAAFPASAATQKFKGAGSDLIFRAGKGYESTAQFNRGIVSFTQNGTAGLTFDMQHIWRGIRGGANDLPTYARDAVFENATDPHTQAMGTLWGDTLSNPNDGNVTGINIPNGDDGGVFTFHISGNATFRGTKDGFNDNYGLGTIGLYRQYIEVNDGTNNFRLRRRMRSYPYSADGDLVQVDIDEGVAPNYIPKFYEAAEWVKDTDSRYPTAYFDLMIGADKTIIEEGEIDQFLTSDFTTTKFYTPPQLIADGDNDNILVKASNGERNHYVWRFKNTITTPTVAEGASTGDFTSFKVWNPRYVEIPANSAYAMYRNSSGTVIDVQLTEALDNTDLGKIVNGSGTYIDADTDGQGYSYRTYTESLLGGHPTNRNSSTESFELSGIEVFLGDGTKEWDVESFETLSTPVGSETLQLPTVALGTSYVNNGNRSFRRWKVTHPSGGSQEDNVKWVKFNDPTYTFDSMGSICAYKALQVRGEIRQIISGTVIVNGADYGKEFLFPWRMFKTSQFGGGSTEYFVPTRISITGDGRTQLSAMLGASWTHKPTTTTTETTGFSGDSTGSGGFGDFDNDGDIVRIFQKASAAVDVTEHLDATGFTGTMTLTEIESKIDKVQTTSPITDDDLGGGGGTGLFGDLFPVFIKRF